MQVFGLILIVIGIFDLAFAAMLRGKLRKFSGEPPRVTRWVVSITYATGVLALLAGVLLLVLG